MSGGHDDYAVEPIRGLPEMPPPGEIILWQGAPGWWPLAKSVFHIRAIAMYFALLMLWRGSVHFHNAGQGAGHWGAAALAALSLLPVSMIGLGLLALLAKLSSRTSVYTITNRRVVLRIGVALPVAINIPFSVIGAAGLGLHADGAGDIPLSLSGAARVPYAMLWPHARPWRLNKPEPMLRDLPDAQRVAGLLRAALLAAQPATASDAAVAPPVREVVTRHGGLSARPNAAMARTASAGILG